MNYWNNRYKKGGNSGLGSYGDYSKYKAEIVNKYIMLYNVKTICDLGCGDGNQLSLFDGYEQYYGYDISSHIIEQNRIKNINDKITFVEKIDLLPSSADLTLSLDVIYHIIDPDILHQYLRFLFELSSNLVIIFSSNHNEKNNNKSRHIAHSNFTDFICTDIQGFRLLDTIDNALTTSAKFFIYKRD